MSTPIDDLTAARKRLVEERRQSAKSLAGPFEHGMTNESRLQFVGFQEAIEAIDRALEDEQKLQPLDASVSKPIKYPSSGIA
jgi:hypothetical protein